MSKTTENIEQMLQYLDLHMMATTLDSIVRSSRFQDMDVIEILQEMVASEFDAKNAKSTRALLRLARLASSQADLDKADYHPKRELNQSFLKQLKSCEYIADRKNIYILGYSGSGKSYFAQALGIEACSKQYRTKYLRDTQGFIEDLELLKSSDPKKFKRRFSYYCRIQVLILDDFLLMKVSNDTQLAILFNLIKEREGLKTTIVCSQFFPEGMHDQLGGTSALAEAITRRNVDNGYLLFIAAGPNGK
ncbi:MAG: hypothetical protein EOM45_11270 [Clostridia bacterium]|nr:hypothetical protein [Clostridia bacterium]